MGKTKAKALMLTETLTFGDLRKMVRDASTKGGSSNVNPSIPLARTCQIYTGAIAGYPDEEKPKLWTYDAYKCRDVPSKVSLIVSNILRDCAP